MSDAGEKMGIGRGATPSRPEMRQGATALRPKMRRGATPSHPEKREVGNADD